MYVGWFLNRFVFSSVLLCVGRHISAFYVCSTQQCENPRNYSATPPANRYLQTVIRTITRCMAHGRRPVVPDCEIPREYSRRSPIFYKQLFCTHIGYSAYTFKCILSNMENYNTLIYSYFTFVLSFIIIKIISY